MGRWRRQGALGTEASGEEERRKHIITTDFDSRLHSPGCTGEKHCSPAGDGKSTAKPAARFSDGHKSKCG